MRRLLFISFFFINYCGLGLAQKRQVDTSTLANWPELLSSKISSDGKYVLYGVQNKAGAGNLFIKSIQNSYCKEYSGVIDGEFTSDSRRVVFIMPGDSLCIAEPGENKEIFVPNILSFIVPNGGDGRWLAYHSKGNELFLYDFSSAQITRYPDVGNFQFDDGGSVLLMSGEDSVRWVDLRTKESLTIWKGSGGRDFSFGRWGSRLAFIAGDSIWYYEKGMDRARLLVGAQTAGRENGYRIKDGPLHFSPDGRMLFFNLNQDQDLNKKDLATSSVDVWSYRDEFLQSEQLEAEDWRSYTAVISLDDKTIARLEQKADRLWGGSKLNHGAGDDYLLTATRVNTREGYHLLSARPDVYLIRTRDGLRKCIIKKLWGDEPEFSPGGKYVYWYDYEKKAYLTYDIQSGQVANISAGVHTSVFWETSDIGGPAHAYGAATWLKNDEAMLIYDRYDIWKLEPHGTNAPVNITNGYGRKNKIALRLVYLKNGNPVDEPPVGNQSEVWLCGFEEVSKNNGFFKKKLDEQGDPQRLTMARSFFYFPDPRLGFVTAYSIVKAKNADIYLLKRMSATEYPNLQVTSNFIDFKPVTQLSPQRDVNWLTDELVHWRTFDGRMGEGILYKPENFDPNKKHPIIFYFYELLSDELNNFITPDLSDGPMNIPWFVSRGYLVFCPDIHYTLGDPGGSAYNYVVSAAKVMSQKAWVDGSRMAIQGHSWGGYEVNYLITRTNIFAAAASAAGPADWVSDYGSLAFGETDMHDYIEQAQPRMGATLWQKPKGYINNSPVFSVDKVTTPLLIMHNKGDLTVPWAQGIEYFTDLRRAGKKVWMLQYDQSYHTLNNEIDQLDYTIRLQQFFDHYLGGTPAPKWMTVGVPAKLKRIDSGLGLDTLKLQP
jgi:dienelactone hydrolase